MPTCPTCLSPTLERALSCPTCGQSLDPSHALVPGTLLRSGAYRIESVLGQGGFGITYRAWDTGLSSVIALKELFPEGSVTRGLSSTLKPLSTKGVLEFEAAKQAAFKEAQVLYTLSDPSIVRVMAAWEENNTVYIAMELLEGETMQDLLKRTVLPEVQAVALLRRFLQALDKVHAQGVLHRDLKPDNLMLTARHGPVIIDFGNARAYSALGATQYSKIIATPAYAAPEQFTAQARFGPATDIYGLVDDHTRGIG